MVNFRLVPQLSNTRFVLICVFVLIASLGLRAWNIQSASLTADEVMTEYRAHASLVDAFRSILKTIDQVPFYFLALHLLPTQNELMLRLPSVFLGVVGTAMVMIGGLRLYNSRMIALLAGVWVAVNPLHIWLTRQARPYAMIFVFSLLLSYCYLWLWEQDGRRSRLMWIGFTLFSMAAYLTHHTLLAVPVVQLVLIAVHIRSKLTFARRWVLSQLIAAAPLLIWMIIVLVNFESRDPQWGASPTIRDIGLSLWNMMVGYTDTLQWYALPGFLAAGIGIGILLFRFDLTIVDTYWLMLVIVPIGMVFAISQSPVNIYMDRYFMVLMPGLAFLIAAGWAKLSYPMRILALAAVILSGTTNVIASYSCRDQREDWRSAAAYIQRGYKPNDVFVVDREVTMTSLKRYYAPDNACNLAVLQLSETTYRQVDQVPAIVGRYWVVYRNPVEDIHNVGALPTFDPFVPQPSIISDWLLPNIQYVVEFQVFKGVTVLLLQVS